MTPPAALRPAEPVGTLLEAARAWEPDRYIAALIAPAGVRSDLLALAALSAELDRIPALVSEPVLGEIRLQWWRDAINGASRGEATGHPVADAIATTIRTHRLPTADLLRMIEGRSFSLSHDLHPDDASLEHNLSDAQGAAFSLAAVILSGELPSPALADAAAVAYGLARDLGRLPALLHDGGFPLPEARLIKFGVTRAMLAEHPHSPQVGAGIEAAAADLEARAMAALGQARRELATDGRGALAAFLPLAMVEPYFAAQKQKGFRRREHMQEVVPLLRIWKLWLAHLKGRP